MSNVPSLHSSTSSSIGARIESFRNSKDRGQLVWCEGKFARADSVPHGHVLDRHAKAVRLCREYFEETYGPDGVRVFASVIGAKLLTERVIAKTLEAIERARAFDALQARRGFPAFADASEDALAGAPWEKSTKTFLDPLDGGSSSAPESSETPEKSGETEEKGMRPGVSPDPRPVTPQSVPRPQFRVPKSSDSPSSPVRTGWGLDSTLEEILESEPDSPVVRVKSLEALPSPATPSRPSRKSHRLSRSGRDMRETFVTPPKKEEPAFRPATSPPPNLAASSGSEGKAEKASSKRSFFGLRSPRTSADPAEDERRSRNVERTFRTFSLNSPSPRASDPGGPSRPNSPDRKKSGNPSSPTVCRKGKEPKSSDDAVAKERSPSKGFFKTRKRDHDRSPSVTPEKPVVSFAPGAFKRGGLESYFVESVVEELKALDEFCEADARWFAENYGRSSDRPFEELKLCYVRFREAKPKLVDRLAGLREVEGLDAMICDALFAFRGLSLALCEALQRVGQPDDLVTLVSRCASKIERDWRNA